MFFHQFEVIFDSLTEIENIFKHNPGEKETKELAGRLLQLRNIMDECVKRWLNFEERVNELQKNYNITLPDLLPDGFLQDPGPGQETGRLSLPGRAALPDAAEKMSPVFQLDSEQGLGAFRKGMGFWDLSMLDEAIREFEKLVVQEPNYIFGHFCLGLAYSEKGLYEQALNKLRFVKALTQSHQLKALVHNSMGNIYVKKRKPVEALHEFGQAVEEDSLYFTGYFNMGVVLYNQQRYAEAGRAFEKAKQISPQDWEICYYLGKAYTLAGNFKQGLQNLKRAFSLNPGESRIIFELGVIYDLMGDRQNALLCYNRILDEQN